MKVTATDDDTHRITALLDGNSAHASIGGNGKAGTIVAIDDGGVTRVKILSGKEETAGQLSSTGGANVPSHGSAGFVTWAPPAESVTIDGQHSRVTVGSNSTGGALYVTGSTRVPGAVLSAGRLALGDGALPGRVALDAFGGTVKLSDADGRQGADLDGAIGRLTLNGIYARTGEAKERIILDAGTSSGNFGGNGTDGGIALFPAAATKLMPWDQASIALRGGDAALIAGDKSHGGQLFLQGGSKDAPPQIVVGSDRAAGFITMLGDDGKGSIVIDGRQGDIILENADCAEDFDVESALVEPGTVMVIGPGGTLRPSTTAYDRKAAGVVSGAGKCKPAIILGKKRSSTPRKPVALSGTAYCKVDAGPAVIEVGDLLTTSDVPGHAMKAIDPLRAFGAVVGKALEPLSTGQGLIAILVALQ